jgi:hypothetical protein
MPNDNIWRVLLRKAFLGRDAEQTVQEPDSEEAARLREAMKGLRNSMSPQGMPDTRRQAMMAEFRRVKDQQARSRRNGAWGWISAVGWRPAATVAAAALLMFVGVRFWMDNAPAGVEERLAEQSSTPMDSTTEKARTPVSGEPEASPDASGPEPAPSLAAAEGRMARPESVRTNEKPESEVRSDSRRATRAEVAELSSPPAQQAAFSSAERSDRAALADESTDPSLLQADRSSGREAYSEFVPVGYAAPLHENEFAQLLRVRMNTVEVERLGFAVPEDAIRESITADILVGEDGLARAVRFVRQD